jgi:microcystin-dependent protein
MKTANIFTRMVLGLALLTIVSANLFGQEPPGKIAHQGFLTDATGTPIGADAAVLQTINFRLYTAITGGTAIWASQQYVTVDKGYFSVLLGEGSVIGTEPFSADLNNVFTSQGTLYLEMQMVADNSALTTLAPRLQFQSAPYAFLSQAATRLTSSSGSVTLTETGTGYVLEGSDPNLTVSGTVKAASFEGNGTIPVGGIIMWSGTAIPSGWALCDGKTVNGRTTPNLTGRFIVGGTVNTIGITGGQNSVALTKENLPSFTATVSIATKQIGFAAVKSISGEAARTPNGGSGNDGGKLTGDATFTGSATPLENRPSYFTLAYIMRVE